MEHAWNVREGQNSRRGRKVKESSTEPPHASGVRFESPVSLPLAFISDSIRAVLPHANIFGYTIHLIKEEIKVGTLEGNNRNSLACLSLDLCTPVIVLFSPQKRLCLRCVQLLWCFCCQDTKPKCSLCFNVIPPISTAGHTFSSITWCCVILHDTTPLSTVSKPVRRHVCAGPVGLDYNIGGNILSMGVFGFPYNSSFLANA